MMMKEQPESATYSLCSRAMYGTDRQREGLGERATNKGVSTERLGCDVPTLCISWLRLLGAAVGAVSKQFGSSRRRISIMSDTRSREISRSLRFSLSLFCTTSRHVCMWTTAATCMVSYCTDFVCQDSSFTTDYKPGPPRDSEETLPKDMQSTAEIR